MSNLWREDFVKVNQYTRPGLKLSSVKKIVLHWTANPGASADAHQRYFNGTAITSKTYASAHLFVDSKEAICIIPLSEMAYHANDVYEKTTSGARYRGVPAIAPNANKVSIGVEMCVEKDGTISDATEERTVQVIAELCKMNGLTAEDIVRHYDITHKPCPMPFIKASDCRFTEFKAKVAAILCPVSPPNPAEVVTEPKAEAKPPVKAPAPKPLPKMDTIGLNSRGSAVKTLQTKVGVKADGIFGAQTQAAVKKFQKANGLVADGIVGAKTWAKLLA
ncbi:N-acetylmuramoyl-L-alanine amidase [Gottfriedia sp. S16(2024)]|uniref:peptidoglycan recognition protein family protein n=1 Tax=Gottfriedia sp. S16(2024) TaxID=3162883 RepID=UPI003D2386FD